MAVVTVSNAVGTGIRIVGVEFSVPQYPTVADPTPVNEDLGGNRLRTTHSYSDGRTVAVDILARRPLTMMDVVLSKNGTELVAVHDINVIISNGGQYLNLDGMWRYDDLISGNRYADVIMAKSGNDTIRGQSGNDRLYGESGNDSLSGQGGADRLYGDAGEDFMAGGAGKDWLYGDTGKDTLDGGADQSADLFVFRNTVESLASTPDVIRNLRQGDRIDLHILNGNDLHFSTTGAARNAVWVKKMASIDGYRVSVDVTGDAKADLVILVEDKQGMNAGHFWL